MDEKMTPEQESLLQLAIAYTRDALYGTRQTHEEVEAALLKHEQAQGWRDQGGKLTLLGTCLLVSGLNGPPLEGESPEAYRDRIIASGIVSGIEPGQVTPRGYAKVITTTISFTSEESAKPEAPDD